MNEDAAAADELLLRLRRFHSDYFPLHQQRGAVPTLCGARWTNH